ADISWLRLSRKQDRHTPRSERYRRLPPFSEPIRTSRSSKAERPPDKRETGERYPARRPFSVLNSTQGKDTHEIPASFPESFALSPELQPATSWLASVEPHLSPVALFGSQGQGVATRREAGPVGWVAGTATS